MNPFSQYRNYLTISLLVLVSGLLGWILYSNQQHAKELEAMQYKLLQQQVVEMRARMENLERLNTRQLELIRSTVDIVDHIDSNLVSTYRKYHSRQSQLDSLDKKTTVWLYTVSQHSRSAAARIPALNKPK